MILTLGIAGIVWPTTALTQAKPDSVHRIAEPFFVQTSLLAAPQVVGGQVRLGLLLYEVEKRVIKKSGREKVIFKDRILSAGPGFYYQQYLHTNVFLTVDYAFVRRHRSGFYRTFAPLLGVSRTVLNSTTYTVDDNGTVGQDKTAGDWRLMTGFTWGIGKRFDTHKPRLLRDVHLLLNVPVFYPNFRSFVLKPSFLLGVSFNLNQLRYSFAKTSKTISR